MSYAFLYDVSNNDCETLKNSKYFENKDSISVIFYRLDAPVSS